MRMATDLLPSLLLLLHRSRMSPARGGAYFLTSMPIKISLIDLDGIIKNHQFSILILIAEERCTVWMN
jgi:hypothetical protein